MKNVGEATSMKVYEGGCAAKQKFDDVGGTDAVVQTAEAVAVGAVWAGDKAITGTMWAGNAVND